MMIVMEDFSRTWGKGRLQKHLELALEILNGLSFTFFVSQTETYNCPILTKKHMCSEDWEISSAVLMVAGSLSLELCYSFVHAEVTHFHQS